MSSPTDMVISLRFDAFVAVNIKNKTLIRGFIQKVNIWIGIRYTNVVNNIILYKSLLNIFSKKKSQFRDKLCEYVCFNWPSAWSNYSLYSYILTYVHDSFSSDIFRVTNVRFSNSNRSKRYKMVWNDKHFATLSL